MFRGLTLLLATGTLLLSACAGAPSSDGKLYVITTFSILGDLVHHVGGDRVEIHTLVRPGQDAHTYQPGPSDGVALAGASLIFENGLGFETWLDDLYASAGSKAERVVVTQGLTPRFATAGDEAGATDPHAWHNVANAIRMTQNIRDALTRVDPANADFYRANADTYLAELQALDAWVSDQAQSLPESRRKLVTTHDTFGYFAARYGFEIIGTVLPTTTEGASPSAEEIAQLVESVKAAGVPAVFAENVSSNTLLQQVAREAGVNVVASLYTDALGPPGSEGDTYVKMIRYNVTKIVAELSK